MRPDAARFLLPALLLAFGSPRPALAAKYVVAAGSEVSFVAKITGGTFVARSESLGGQVEYDEGSQTLKASEVSVEASSFTTGVALRDRHMRDKYLEADTFKSLRFAAPEAVLRVKPKVSFPLEGTFTIKGVRHPTTVEVTVTQVGDGKFELTSRFPLKVTDYAIPQPAFAVVKMDPEIDVTLKLVFVRER